LAHSLQPPVKLLFKRLPAEAFRSPKSSHLFDQVLPPFAMSSRSERITSQRSDSSGREMNYPSDRSPVFATSLNSSPLRQAASGHYNMGLATYSHDREDQLMTRSFLFRDEEVHSINFHPGYPAGRDQDHQRNCTSFGEVGSVQSPDHAIHCYTNTNIDQSAQVFNGDIARAYDTSSTREHHLHGGSVKNGSKLVNGDLDRETFLAIFCGAEVDIRGEASRHRPGSSRRRRRGPRVGNRAGMQESED
ncbi:hypothetical protein N7451_011997, partial [Penicillium sp. IBT 35674x]